MIHDNLDNEVQAHETVCRLIVFPKIILLTGVTKLDLIFLT